MLAPKLPAVLQQPHDNSLSVERVLKQAKLLIEQSAWPQELEDQGMICLEDLATLLANIE